MKTFRTEKMVHQLVQDVGISKIRFNVFMCTPMKMVAWYIVQPLLKLNTDFANFNWKRWQIYASYLKPIRTVDVFKYFKNSHRDKTYSCILLATIFIGNCYLQVIQHWAIFFIFHNIFFFRKFYFAFGGIMQTTWYIFFKGHWRPCCWVILFDCKEIGFKIASRVLFIWMLALNWLSKNVKVITQCYVIL